VCLVLPLLFIASNIVTVTIDASAAAAVSALVYYQCTFVASNGADNAAVVVQYSYHSCSVQAALLSLVCHNDLC
jgi:nicotinamide riboside transporter PnuC